MISKKKAKIKIESVVVKKDRIVAIVKTDAAGAYTTPEIAARVSADFPDVPRHACLNARGPTFGHVMKNTSLPHLLEHLIIDIQASEYTENEREAKQKACAPLLVGTTKWIDKQAGTKQKTRAPLLVGTTKWIDKQAGLAQVQVKMVSDLYAMRAIKQACEYINSL